MLDLYLNAHSYGVDLMVMNNVFIIIIIIIIIILLLLLLLRSHLGRFLLKVASRVKIKPVKLKKLSLQDF